MGKIDNHTERFAFPHNVAPECGQSIARRTTGRKNSAAAGRVSPRVREPNDAQAEFVKRAHQIQISAKWLDSFHGD